MEELKKNRTVMRTRITKLQTATDLELSKDEKDVIQLEVNLHKVEKLLSEINDLDEKMMNAILSLEVDDEMSEAVSKEIDDTLVYVNKLERMRVTLSKIVHPVPEVVPRTSSPSSSEYGSARSGAMKKKTYKLPKFEMPKFGGELTEWIGWWGQFRKIDEDEDLFAIDKFRYLCQAMVPGSKAEKVVMSYTPSDENYGRAIEALKDRYGDEGQLRQMYVKDLIQHNLPKCGCPKQKGKKELVSYFDSLMTKIDSLRALKVDMENYAFVLYPLIESNLSDELLRIWHRHPDSADGSTGEELQANAEAKYKGLLKFLRKEVKEEERLNAESETRDEAKKYDKKKSHPVPDRNIKREYDECDFPTVSGLHISQRVCVFCEKKHLSQECYELPKMTTEEVQAKIMEKNLCGSCLKPGHYAKDCRNKPRCMNCEKGHFTNLCHGLRNKCHEQKSGAGEKMDKNNDKTTTIGCNALSVEDKNVMLMEVLLVKLDHPKCPKTMRVLFDSGSQSSYIRESVADAAELPVKKERTEHNIVFESDATMIRSRKIYDVPISSLDGKCKMDLELASCQRINEHVPRVPQGPWLKELRRKKVWLSDFVSDSREIDILIGVDLMDKLMTGKTFRLRNGMRATEYLFGWTLRGPAPYRDCAVGMMVANLNVSDMPVHKLWELDQIGIHDKEFHDKEDVKEAQAKSQFLKTVTRDDEGRYVVALPWVGGEQDLPTNKCVAEKRLRNITKKLQKDDMLKKYDEIFKTWIDEGIIEEVTPESKDKNERVHYLPHRPVYKPDSLTTPVRPVFDASCKVGRFPSLNECLEKGPNLIELIPNVMLRFREGKIGVISDIRKAFQMISVQEDERDYFRFLWWENGDCEKLKEYRHSRVVFGATCSPFLLGAVLEHHVLSGNGFDTCQNDVKKKFLESLYVDNCVTSVDSIEEFEDFQTKTVMMLDDCKMDLRQWEWAMKNMDEESYFPQDKPLSSVLGMKWDKTDDMIGYDPVPEIPSTMTKRSILSMQQKIFDPMGYLAPALLPPKIILQEAWLQDLDWDSELSEDLKDKCMKWVEEMRCLNEIWIPRNFTGGVSDKSKWGLYVFCDASQLAYAACIFLRTTDEDGTVSVQLLQAKARVAPRKRNKDGTIQKMTIPRLELMSCLVAARLTASVKKALNLDVPTRYHTDSENAFAWIRGNDEWGTFVGNRVKEIVKLAPANLWYHVPGKENPADLPSRGCSPRQLVESRWWEGPKWLKDEKEFWPIKDHPTPDKDVMASERRKMVKSVKVNITSPEKSPFPYLSFQKNVEFVMSTQRFLKKLMNKDENKKPVEDALLAEKTILKYVQDPSQLMMEAKKRKLAVLVDDDGVLRVKSRLLMREDNDDFLTPILLPKGNDIVEQLVMKVHLENGHAGVQIMMSVLRESYWILQSRKVIQKVLKSCIRCQKLKARCITVPDAPLPQDRVKDAKVFEVVGVDLAGPLYLKGGKKTWIVLFTCAVYRAIHLELVSSLRTDAFLLAFFRFMGIRGRPAVIYSDNGTNFTGASNLFKEMDWKMIEKEMSVKKIRWNFNPPSAPWWGGWWEVLVREVKKLIIRMCGRKTLDYEELSTILTEISSIINSRPLTYVTEDGDDLIPLTPAMFMQEMKSDPAPEWKVMEGGDLRRKYKKMNQLRKELRGRFRSEYLSLLMGKSTVRSHPLKVNDIVLVGSDVKKRIEWPMARVLEILPGKDNEVRTARVKTENGILIRPLQRLYPLEVLSQDEIVNPAPDIKKKAKGIRHRKKEDERMEASNVEDPEDFLTKRGRRTKKPKSYGK